MKTTQSTPFLLGSVLTLAISATSPLQAAFNYEVSGFQEQIVGSETNVLTSGSSANYDSNTSVNDFAVFDMQAVDTSNGSVTDFADLKVTYRADNGGVGSDIMIAQTTNSQGLEDSATISILVDIGNGSGGTVDIEFEWYEPGSFSGGIEQSGATTKTTQVKYTSLDIDFVQLNRVKTTEMESATLFDSGLDTTQLTAVDNGTTITVTDDGADSEFGDPTTAVQFLSKSGLSSHTITMGKQSTGGPALFMLEFRDPSQIVPEPSSLGFIFGLVGLAAVGLRRRIR